MTNTIILTGAIRPSWPLRRNDPMTRLTDYLCAIRRWLEVPTLKQVIYCDASDCVIPEEVFASEKFESLSFDASDHARKYEAGRAEAESLAFVLEKTRFRFDAFFKCTGRNFVDNFERLRTEMKLCPDTPLFLRQWYLHDWADTRFFQITTEKFQQWIKPRIRELTGKAYEGHVIESLFYEYFVQAKSFSEPRLIGHAGHGNNLYDEDYSDAEIRCAHEIIKKFGMETFLVNNNESLGMCKNKTCPLFFPVRFCILAFSPTSTQGNFLMTHCPDNRIQILDARVHTGTVGMDGLLGYDDLETSIPADYRSWNCVSAHGPSELTVNVVKPIELVGCMNGSMRVYREDGIRFSVDGDAIDALHGPWDVTRSLILAPGKHALSVGYSGNPEYCHSLWMYRTIAKDLATPENTVFASAAAFGANFENATKVFRRSAEHFGFPITFVDQDKEFQGYYEHKIKAMGMELRRQQELGKTFAFLLDCRDIFFLHPIQTVLAKFNALYEDRLIFNADFVGETWPVDKIWFLRILQHLKEKSYVCLNSGFIAGKIDAILAVMDKIEEMRAEFFSGSPKHPILAKVYGELGLHREQDDQLWYHLCLALYPELIEVDEKKLLATFIKDFPKREPRFNDDSRALDAICKASVIHGAYPSHHPDWENWANQMMKFS